MALAVEEAAKTTPGKRSLAMEAFARALRALPTTICDNAGLDSADIVATLRAVRAVVMGAACCLVGDGRWLRLISRHGPLFDCT